MALVTTEQRLGRSKKEEDTRDTLASEAVVVDLDTLPDGEDETDREQEQEKEAKDTLPNNGIERRAGTKTSS